MGRQFERTLVFNECNGTASGVNGYLPIMQALVEAKLGKEAYRELTRWMVLPRPEERTHLAFHMLDLIEQQDELLRKLHVAVEQLAASAATLARKVLAASGMPAAAYIRRVKLKQVSERLFTPGRPPPRSAWSWASAATPACAACSRT